jgi:uncharacterized protein (TIGR02145 family)
MKNQIRMSAGNTSHPGQRILGHDRKFFTILFVLVLLIHGSGAFALPVEHHYARSVDSDSQSVQVAHGWNLVSLPLRMSDRCARNLFPHAASSAFIFHNGNQPKDTLSNGYGYWIKFDSSETIRLKGNAILRDTIDVRAGWNMIGAISTPIAINAIYTDPPGIIVSGYFAFPPGLGYKSIDTLQPGTGYWVKGSQDGAIILSSASPAGVPGIPCPGIPTVEYAGRTYNTVQVGTQCWLKQNLDVGTMIDSGLTQSDNHSIEKYCYGNNLANCNTYGGLYQWKEAMQYSAAEASQGICPAGWHIPTLAEIQTLKSTFGDDGNAMKAIGQGINNGSGTDTKGFSALLTGYRDLNGGFSLLGMYTSIWGSTEDYGLCAIYLNLYYNYSFIYTDYLDYANLNYGFSVRCVQN